MGISMGSLPPFQTAAPAESTSSCVAKATTGSGIGGWFAEIATQDSRDARAPSKAPDPARPISLYGSKLRCVGMDDPMQVSQGSGGEHERMSRAPWIFGGGPGVI